MAINKLGKLFFTCFSVLTLLLVCFIGFLTVTGTKTFAVQTDSMSPLINKGDAVFVRKVDTDTLQAGDVVTVKFKDGSGVFTHRISRMEPQNSLIYTKGDKNSSEDPAPSAYSQIIGRMWFSIPYIGKLSLAMGSKTLIISMAGIAIALALVQEVVYLRKKAKGKGGEEDA